jgi:hypothetical protein
MPTLRKVILRSDHAKKEEKQVVQKTRMVYKETSKTQECSSLSPKSQWNKQDNIAKCTALRRSVCGVQKQDWSRKWQSSSLPPTAQRSKQHDKLVRITARIKTKQIWSKKDSIVHCLQLCKEAHSITPPKAIPWESLQATKQITLKSKNFLSSLQHCKENSNVAKKKAAWHRQWCQLEKLHE